MSYIGKQPRKAALTSSDIEDGIITAAKIEDGAVVAAEIASNAVTTAKINADAVTGAKIADDVINSEHIVADSIDAEHYAAGSVDTTALGADAVTGAKIADDAINSEHYTDGSIDTAHIAADQITNAKIADDQIDSEHYVDGSIDTAHIADVNVTQGKIADQAINEAKMQISNAPTNGYMLTAQSGNTGGLTWAAAGGGKILQVVTDTFSGAEYTTSSQTFNNTGLSLAITPSTSNSRIMLFANINGAYINESGNRLIVAFFRDSTNLRHSTYGNGCIGSHESDGRVIGHLGLSHLDSPSSTSEITYKVKGRLEDASGAGQISQNTAISSITAMEVGA